MVVGEFTTESELVVIGGGLAGCHAALRAAELGVETTIVDDHERPGGRWLHGGGLARREGARIASLLRATARAAKAGLLADGVFPVPDPAAFTRHVDALIETEAARLEAALREHDVAWATGHARLDNSRQLSIARCPTTPRLRFKRALVATGRRLPARGGALDAPSVLDPAALLGEPAIPATLLVVGAGVTAVEIVEIYSALGSRVTLLLDGDILPGADDDLVEAVRGGLGRSDVRIVTDAAVAAIDESDVEFTSGAGGRFARIVAAPDAVPDVDDLGLERTAITRDATGSIAVDASMRTDDPRLFAAGDVVGRGSVPAAAMQQGRVAAEAVAGEDGAFDACAFPTVVHTCPPAAWCGLTEEEAVRRGDTVSVARASIAGDATAADGLVKLVFDPDSRIILGAAIVAAGAHELIGEAALAVEMGAVLADLAATLHAPSGDALARAAQAGERAGGRA